MGRALLGGAAAFRFMAREVRKNIERVGQKPIQWKQVWNWFQNRRHSQKSKIAKSPDKPKAAIVIPNTSQPKKVPASSTAVPSGPVRSRSDTWHREFESKFVRDGAWYDVSTFISHRLAPSGDPMSS